MVLENLMNMQHLSNAYMSWVEINLRAVCQLIQQPVSDRHVRNQVTQNYEFHIQRRRY